MVGTDENPVQLIDRLRNIVIKLQEDREAIERESHDLRTARRLAEEKAWATEERLKQTELELANAKKRGDDLSARVSELQSRLDEAEARARRAETERDSYVSELKRERDELKAEMDQITERLNKVSELYREAAAEKERLQEKVDVSDLLSIYIVLIEKIFGGKPHARVLYTLHNTKSKISRKNLESSTGIMPAAVMKAIHDLRNAELISFDEESQEVELIKDIF
ncbi:MAG: hypothetical protein QXS20_10155 [Candidatus Thorarchaeota archaeon]